MSVPLTLRCFIKLAGGMRPDEMPLAPGASLLILILGELAALPDGTVLESNLLTRVHAAASPHANVHFSPLSETQECRRRLISGLCSWSLHACYPKCTCTCCWSLQRCRTVGISAQHCIRVQTRQPVVTQSAAACLHSATS